MRLHGNAELSLNWRRARTGWEFDFFAEGRARRGRATR
jgi:hypothetical protein